MGQGLNAAAETEPEGSDLESERVGSEWLLIFSPLAPVIRWCIRRRVVESLSLEGAVATIVSTLVLRHHHLRGRGFLILKIQSFYNFFYTFMTQGRTQGKGFSLKKSPPIVGVNFEKLLAISLIGF